jgi:hypothetical protein
MNASYHPRFVRDETGLHYHGETYVHHATDTDVQRVLRAIREMHAAGFRPLRPLKIIAAVALPQTRVRVVLKWLGAVAPTWRRCRKGAFAISDGGRWQREVASAWLAIDDPDEVTPADLADVFGDNPPPPDPPDPEDCDGEPDAPGPALEGDLPTIDPTAGPEAPPLDFGAAA